jgi:hypothetical protein
MINDAWTKVLLHPVEIKAWEDGAIKELERDLNFKP